MNREDAREERVAKSEFDSLLEALPDAAIVVDASGGITAANSPAGVLFGCDAQELVGLAVDELVPEAQRGGHVARRNGFLASDDRRRPMAWGRSLRALRRDGATFAAEVALSAVERPDGVRVLALIRDVGDREAAAAKLRQANESLEARVRDRTLRLETALAELESFTHAVSHDLRAPLRTLGGFVTALQEDCSSQLDETGLEYLRRISAGRERMVRLIDDLLRLSRVTTVPVRRSEVDVTALARALGEEIDERYSGVQATLLVEEGLRARADPDLLRVALDNLLDNARKFSCGAVAPVIRVGATPGPTGPVFFVSDNGAGFDPQFAGKLFGAFQRLHSVAEFPGTGVGLATTRRIISRHGGTISAEGRLGEGATFRFTLPEGGAA